MSFEVTKRSRCNILNIFNNVKLLNLSAAKKKTKKITLHTKPKVLSNNLYWKIIFAIIVVYSYFLDGV